MSAYASLESKFGLLNDIGGVQSVLGWDRETMMPHGASAMRAEQQATLATIAHRMLTETETADLLDKAAGESLDEWQTANLALMQRQFADASALPADLVSAFARSSSETEMRWRAARAADDYASVLPAFEALLGLVREVAAIKSAAFGLSPYDAMLDSYQPDLRAAEIDALFAELKGFLPGFIDRAIARQATMPTVSAPPTMAADANQMALCKAVAGRMGFDFHQGRLDLSAHPFSSGSAHDVRITTRFTDGNLLAPLMGVMHETGHALYAMGCPEPWLRQPVGQASGMVIHESQSLIMEMQAGRQRRFADFLAAEMVSHLKIASADCSGKAVHRALTQVGKTFIRVGADEATYPVHVILRYGLEQDLLSGDLAPADLPGAWNEGMRAMLGIVPPTDTLGCLQDPHWYGGAFGYFPTYTLGALLAAQLFQAALRAHPAIETELGEGNFSTLLEWLRVNIHAEGSRKSWNQLVKDATGKPLGVADFKAHLERRYLG